MKMNIIHSKVLN